jgi:predicted phosphodiesterase
MALYGVLGDIHGNIEALDAVLRVFDSREITQLLCVGDVIGYNADSDACIARLRARRVRVIAGNHDLIGTQRLGFERCSNKARFALQRTRRSLSRESVAWLTALPDTSLVDGSIALVHGGVRDVQLYMTTPQHIRRNGELLSQDFPTARVCFFGHSHEQKVYDVTGVEYAEGALDRERVYFVNAGSVDAQRKRGEKLAECAIFDSDAWNLEFLRVRYDAAATEAKAVVGGYRMLPVTDALYTLRKRAERAAGQTASYFSRLMRSMLIPSMRMSWVALRRRGEWRSPSL